MTSLKRWLAAINQEVVDQLPFWPKIGTAYLNAQEKEFKYMSLEEIYDWIGCDPQFSMENGIKMVGKDNYNINKSKEKLEITYYTSGGITRSVQKFDSKTQSWYTVTYPIKNEKDIKLMIEWYDNIEWEVDKNKLIEINDRVNEVNKKGITMTSLGQSPLMEFVQAMAGLKNAQYFLYDSKELIEKLFAVMHKSQLDKTELISKNNLADLIYLTENTSTTLVSPSQFKEYCLNHINDYGRIVKRNNKKYILHMCGHLKDLLSDLAETNADAFEAFTSPTVGNTTLLNGRDACPDKCLIGGTNVNLWVKSADKIIEKLKRDLDVLSHHRGIIISSASYVPAICKPETIKRVCEWIKEYSINI